MVHVAAVDGNLAGPFWIEFYCSQTALSIAAGATVLATVSIYEDFSLKIQVFSEKQKISLSLLELLRCLDQYLALAIIQSALLVVETLSHLHKIIFDYDAMGQGRQVFHGRFQSHSLRTENMSSKQKT